MASVIEQLHKQMGDAGLSVISVSQGSLGVKFQLADSATDGEKSIAQALVDSFDMTPRRNRPGNVLRTAISNLTPLQRSKLIDVILLRELRRNPEFMTKVGINIPGDEPDV